MDRLDRMMGTVSNCVNDSQILTNLGNFLSSVSLGNGGSMWRNKTAPVIDVMITCLCREFNVDDNNNN